MLLKENLVEDQFEEVHVNLLNCTSEIFVDSPTRVIEENAVHLEESEKLDDSKGGF